MCSAQNQNVQRREKGCSPAFYFQANISKWTYNVAFHFRFYMKVLLELIMKMEKSEVAMDPGTLPNALQSFSPNKGGF